MLNVHTPYIIGSPSADLSKLADRSVDPLPISGCQLVAVNRYFRKTRLPECWPSDEERDKLSAFGRTVKDDCSTDYLTTVYIGKIGHRRSYNYTLMETAVCPPKTPILASKTLPQLISGWYIQSYWIDNGFIHSHFWLKLWFSLLWWSMHTCLSYHKYQSHRFLIIPMYLIFLHGCVICLKLHVCCTQRIT